MAWKNAADRKVYKRAWYLAHKSEILEKDAKRKITCFNRYSNYDIKCACCGERGLPFLSLDHIKGNGAAHRNIKSSGTDNKYLGSIYRWTEKNNYPPGFQVLCMNCNFAKGNSNECPHQTEKRLNEKQIFRKNLSVYERGVFKKGSYSKCGQPKLS